MRQFTLLFPRHLLLCLRSAVKTDETQVVKVSQDGFLEFEAMRGEVGRIRGVLYKYEGE